MAASDDDFAQAVTADMGPGRAAVIVELTKEAGGPTTSWLLAPVTYIDTPRSCRSALGTATGGGDFPYRSYEDHRIRSRQWHSAAIQ
jgi:hypothetical protein